MQPGAALTGRGPAAPLAGCRAPSAPYPAQVQQRRHRAVRVRAPGPLLRGQQPLHRRRRRLGVVGGLVGEDPHPVPGVQRRADPGERRGQRLAAGRRGRQAEPVGVRGGVEGGRARASQSPASPGRIASASAFRTSSDSSPPGASTRASPASRVGLARRTSARRGTAPRRSCRAGSAPRCPGRRPRRAAPARGCPRARRPAPRARRRASSGRTPGRSPCARPGPAAGPGCPGPCRRRAPAAAAPPGSGRRSARRAAGRPAPAGRRSAGRRGLLSQASAAPPENRTSRSGPLSALDLRLGQPQPAHLERTHQGVGDGAALGLVGEALAQLLLAAGRRGTIESTTISTITTSHSSSAMFCSWRRRGPCSARG